MQYYDKWVLLNLIVKIIARPVEKWPFQNVVKSAIFCSIYLILPTWKQLFIITPLKTRLSA